MRVESLGGFQPPGVEGFTGSVKELVATRGEKIVLESVFVGVSFFTPYTFWVRK